MLASVKHDIEELAKTVHRKVITVTDELEKAKIDKYVEKHPIQGVKMTISKSNNKGTHIYRIFAHPSKEKEFEKLCEDIWLKELKRDGPVPSEQLATKSVHVGKVSDVAADIEKQQLAKTVGAKPKVNSLTTKQNNKNEANPAFEQQKGSKQEIKPKSVKKKQDSPGNKNTNNWKVEAPNESRNFRNDPPKNSVPSTENKREFEKFILLPGLTVKLLQESITKVRVDAVVNAANEHLSNGAGVAKVLSDFGGVIFDKACKDVIVKRKEIPVTKTCVTTAGNMKNCKSVIHAVGPMWDDYRRKEECLDDLCETVKNVLREACAKKFNSVAMPPISSGNIFI